FFEKIDICTCSRIYIYKVQRQCIFKIRILLRGVWITTSTDDKEHIEYIANTAEVTKVLCTAESALTLCTCMAKLIILGSFLLVAQYFIGFFCFFKFVSCIFLFADVRMVFSCQLTISFLYFIFRSAFFNAKHFIIVALTHL